MKGKQVSVVHELSMSDPERSAIDGEPLSPRPDRPTDRPTELPPVHRFLFARVHNRCLRCTYSPFGKMSSRPCRLPHVIVTIIVSSYKFRVSIRRDGRRICLTRGPFPAQADDRRKPRLARSRSRRNEHEAALPPPRSFRAVLNM